MRELEEQSLKMYCPNCGQLITAYTSISRSLKYQCNRCHIVAVRVKKSRRHQKIDVYPKQEDDWR